MLVLAVAAPSAEAKRLAAPKPATPADDQQVSSVPAFTWSKVKKADRYEFMLSADANFGSIVLGKGNGSFTTRNLAATITKSLPDGTYWWRVRAISANNKAGRWSGRRSIRKAWGPAPQLGSPTGGRSVLFPAEPLILRWSAVPRAFKYRVYLATDPTLGSLLLRKEPIETSATVFSPPTSLAPGRYYWAVEPVDAAGHRGPRSEVGSFDWSWPSATRTSFEDLVADTRLTEPHLSWDPIAGAIAYQVEINHSEDFPVGSRVCCDPADTGIGDGLILGTSFTPKRTLASNVYHWRVRGIDANGNAGQWNVSPTPFEQFYETDPALWQPRLRDNHGELPVGSTTDSPVITWDPVPGAASYGVEITRVEDGAGNPAAAGFGACNWSTTAGSEHWDVETTSTSFTVLARGRNGTLPFSTNNVAISVEGSRGFVDGHAYCVRVHAKRGDRTVISSPTYVGGPGAVAFTYDQFLPAPPPDTDLVMPEANYLAPQTGSLQRRAPLFTWDRVPGAHSYFVVVSKSSSFNNIVDVALTNQPAYAPRLRTYADDDTPYYWAVVPAKEDDGVGATTQPSQNSPRSFNKRSIAPALVAPAGDSVVLNPTVFRWASGDPAIATPEGAKEYRLQVSQDPSFVAPLEDVVTKSTSYTSAAAYPADTVLYWRVRVNDFNGVGLSWSQVGTFRRQLPVPVIAPDNSGGGSIIPALTWDPVQGATSYDVHVDQSDGTRKDFKVSGTAFTPVFWYGTGVWRWQVRANFDGGISRDVSSAYSAAQAFSRRIPAPDGVRAETRRGRILMAWEPNTGAGIKEYLVEFSDNDSFASIGQSIRTQNLSVAPDVARAPFADGGPVYWRISAVDEGGNLGGAAAGRFVTAKRMVLAVQGSLVRRKRSKIVVFATDARKRRVRKAKIRVSGRPVGAKSRRTNKRGKAKFSIRPRRKGKIIVRATRDGYRPAQVVLTVR